MNLFAIELNDAGIRAASSRDPVVRVDGDERYSPGVACIEHGAILTGIAAARRSCGHAGGVHDRFWDQLDTEPTDPRETHAPNRAEVAFEHLAGIVRHLEVGDGSIVIAVPSFYDARGLGLLAGIGRELPCALDAVVPIPVALELGRFGTGTLAVVEMTLHRAVVTLVNVTDHLTLGATHVCPHVGRRAFERQWVRSIGAEFVRRTRFDPLHHAETEQQVHDRVPDLIEAIAGDGSDELVIRTSSGGHRLTVTDQLLTEAGRGLVLELSKSVRSVVTNAAATAVVLTHEAASVPGLQTAVQREVAAPVHAVSAGAAAQDLVGAWPERFEAAPGPGVSYHRRRLAETRAPAR